MTPDQFRELVSIRAAYVDRYVTDAVNACEGDCTTEDVTRWENDAFTEWRWQYPALSEAFPSHLSEGVPS